LRATLRREGYAKAWNVLLQLGLTDDTYVIDFAPGATWHDWVESYLPEGRGSLPKRISKCLNLKKGKKVNVLEKLEWLGLFEKKPIPLREATPAQLLQHLIESKWKMGADDKDMVVMVHEFIYKRKGHPREKLISSLVVKGDNAQHTAMAKTVGLPIGIFARQLSHGKVELRGVHIPVMKSVYEPVLQELSERGIVFEERIMKA
jgi:saccharopine dehydrogenase-like NADP-dependent oxidoreductase